MTRTFPIQGIRPGTMAILLVVVAYCGGLGTYLWSIREIQPVAMGLAAVTTWATAGLFLWFAVAQRRSVVAVGDGQVKISIPLYGRTIALNRVVPDSVRVVSLPGDAAYKLTWRTNGLGLPGYQLGWFRAKGAGKVLAAVTSGEVVAFQTVDDYAVLLSVADRAGLERALLG